MLGIAGHWFPTVLPIFGNWEAIDNGRQIVFQQNVFAIISVLTEEHLLSFCRTSRLPRRWFQKQWFSRQCKLLKARSCCIVAGTQQFIVPGRSKSHKYCTTTHYRNMRVNTLQCGSDMWYNSWVQQGEGPCVFCLQHTASFAFRVLCTGGLFSRKRHFVHLPPLSIFLLHCTQNLDLGDFQYDTDPVVFN